MLTLVAFKRCKNLVRARLTKSLVLFYCNLDAKVDSSDLTVVRLLCYHLNISKNELLKKYIHLLILIQAKRYLTLDNTKSLSDGTEIACAKTHERHFAVALNVLQRADLVQKSKGLFREWNIEALTSSHRYQRFFIELGLRLILVIVQVFIKPV